MAAFNLDADLVLLLACNTAASDGSPHGRGSRVDPRILAGWRPHLAGQPLADCQSLCRGRNDIVYRCTKEAAYAATGEALQKAMLDMLDSKDPDFQNPAFWAPFTVVGG